MIVAETGVSGLCRVGRKISATRVAILDLICGTMCVSADSCVVRLIRLSW